MTTEIPQYGLKAYALFYSKHKDKEAFKQSELDWIVGQSMKKKIFALLLNAGWIKKQSDSTYTCLNPQVVINSLLEFKVPQIIKEAEKDYAFTNLSAIEIWSDYSYVQRDIEKSPYFIKVLKKDLRYWKSFFNSHNIPNYVNSGASIGEYIILFPVEKLSFVKKASYKVETLKETIKLAKLNEMYLYAYNYIKRKYQDAAI